MKYSSWAPVLPLVLGISLFAQTPIEIVKVDPHSHTLCGMVDALSGRSETDPWGSCLLIAYKNVSPQRVTGVRFSVNFINAMKEVDETSYSFEDTREVKAGKKLTILFHDGVFFHQYGGDKMSANVAVAKVMFSDGTFWTADTPVESTQPIAAQPPPGVSAELFAARNELTKALGSKMRSSGGYGYAEIKDDTLQIHSERADESRFRQIDAWLPKLKILKITRVIYTNDADKTFTLDVPPASAATSAELH